MSELVACEKDNSVFVIELRRHELGNLLNRQLQHELVAAWEEFEADDSLLVGVIHGAGGVFSVGHDVAELLNGMGDALLPEPVAELFPYTLSKPVIAAVEGPCYGLGFELALSCDLRFAAEDALFGFPDTNLRVSYRLASALLPRLTDLGTSLDLLLTGEVFDSSRMRKLRLVNKVVTGGTVLARAVEFGLQMSSRLGSTRAFRKSQIFQFTGLPLSTAIRQARSESIT